MNLFLFCVLEFLTIYHIRNTIYENGDGRNCPEVFLDKLEYCAIKDVLKLGGHEDVSKDKGVQLRLNAFFYCSTS